MKRLASGIAILAALVAAGTGGYWFARHQSDMSTQVHKPSPAPAGPVIYYQDPDGKAFYSSEPAQTADGRPYRPVHASEDVSFEEPEQAAAPESSTRKLLYYRNPMGLPDVSRTPKKDSMGMDYIPVYEGEDTERSTVTVSPGKLQRIGVKSEPATLRSIAMPLRAPGVIQLDERLISVISLRTEAYVEKVEDVTTGTVVRKGQPLMRVYSAAIASAAADYSAALGFRGDVGAPQGTRQRLVNLAPPPELVAELERTRKVPITFTWTSPRDGIVLERNVSEGMRAQPGDVLFRVADHSHVWATVDVAERDLANLAHGQPVTVRVRSYPDRRFGGTVALVYPHLNPATRTVRVRIELPNKDHLLLPDMYAEAEIDTGSGQQVVAVPESAVIDSGDRQVVIVDKGGGKFEPRNVQIGQRGAGLVEVREGVAEGDMVVTSANFLIDAESNLKAALKSLSDAGAAK